MKKGKSIVFGKRQILLATLVVALAAAVWLNMNYTAGNGGLQVADNTTSSKYLGEATLVGETVSGVAADTDSAVSAGSASEASTGSVTTSTSEEPEQMANARENRDQTREEAIAVLQDTLEAGSGDTSAASTQLAALTKRMEDEAAVETVLAGKGLTSLVVIGDNDVTVMVAADNLLNNQMLQISDAVQSQCSVKAENIKIVTVK